MILSIFILIGSVEITLSVKAIIMDVNILIMVFNDNLLKY